MNGSKVCAVAGTCGRCTNQGHMKQLEGVYFCQVITPQKTHSSLLNCSINCRVAWLLVFNR